jgi:hypothetical protein
MMKEAKKQEEASATRARAIRNAWVERNRVCGEARNILLQLEGWLSEHSKGLYQQVLKCARFQAGIARVIQNGTVMCMEDTPAALAAQLLAGRSLEDIILEQERRPKLKTFYASIRFNGEAGMNIVDTADSDLPVFKRWNFERAAIQILQAAIAVQKQAVLAKTRQSMEKFSRDVAEIRSATARDFLVVLAELKCVVESDQRLVEGLEPDEVACLLPRPFPLQILSSDAVSWLLESVSQGMISPAELAGLQLETVKNIEEEPAPEVRESYLQGQI